MSLATKSARNSWKSISTYPIWQRNSAWITILYSPCWYLSSLIHWKSPWTLQLQSWLRCSRRVFADKKSTQWIYSFRLQPMISSLLLWSNSAWSSFHAQCTPPDHILIPYSIMSTLEVWSYYHSQVLSHLYLSSPAHWTYTNTDSVAHTRRQSFL